MPVRNEDFELPPTCDPSKGTIVRRRGQQSWSSKMSGTTVAEELESASVAPPEKSIRRCPSST